MREVVAAAKFSIAAITLQMTDQKPLRCCKIVTIQVHSFGERCDNDIY